MRSEDDIHVRSPIENCSPFALSQTPGNHDPHVWFARATLAKHVDLTKEPIIGIFANRTGIEYHHVCGILRWRRRHALAPQQRRDPLRIVLVHLTAERLHIKTLHSLTSLAVPSGSKWMSEA
jgi:hypothetical protein